MSIEKYDTWSALAGECKGAHGWQDMSRKRERTGGTFDISVCQSKITLTRCGQFNPSEKNYWESPKALGTALLEEIVSDPSIIKRAIARMERKRDKAMVDLSEWIDTMKKEIEKVKATKEPTS